MSNESAGHRSLNKQARKNASNKGHAMKDGKFPIRNVAELKSAIKLRNSAKGVSQAAVRSHIVKRARALGHTDLLPDEWKQKKKS